MMFITNAKIYTCSDSGIIEKGYIEIERGKIKKVAEGDPEKAFGEVIDASGLTVIPGMIDCHCHLGIWEDAMGFEGDDGNEETDPLTPQMRAIDAINPMDICFNEAASCGITVVVTGPGSANPIGGQFVAMKTKGCRVDDMIISAPAAIKFALGENPKTVYHSKNQAPSTRMATAALIRDQLFKTLEYIERIEIAKNDPDESKPDFDIKCESMIGLFKDKTPAHFHAHRADDIFTAIRIAKEFDLNLAIVHGTEAHMIADYLKNEKVPVITGPALTGRSKPELKNLTFKTPAALAKAGVLCAICTDYPVTPVDSLPLCAAMAMREGMERYDALMAITKNAAIIAGIENRVGSIGEGLDADIVLLDGEPLDFMTRVVNVYIEGEKV